MEKLNRSSWLSATYCIAMALALQLLAPVAASAGSAMTSETQSSTTSSLSAVGAALTRSERQAIVVAASQTIHRHIRDPRREANPPVPRESYEAPLIPRDLWGEAIERLNPLRVRNDLLNVFIVLADHGGRGEGLYVSIPISSHAPGLDDRVLLLEKLTQEGDRSFGILYTANSRCIRRQE